MRAQKFRGIFHDEFEEIFSAEVRVSEKAANLAEFDQMPVFAFKQAQILIAFQFVGNKVRAACRKDDKFLTAQILILLYEFGDFRGGDWEETEEHRTITVEPT